MKKIWFFLKITVNPYQKKLLKWGGLNMTIALTLLFFSKQILSKTMTCVPIGSKNRQSLAGGIVFFSGEGHPKVGRFTCLPLPPPPHFRKKCPPSQKRAPSPLKNTMGGYPKLHINEQYPFFIWDPLYFCFFKD